MGAEGACGSGGSLWERGGPIGAYGSLWARREPVGVGEAVESRGGCRIAGGCRMAGEL